jgi:spermidine synthase
MEKRVRIAVLAMGFSGLVAQILLLREFLIVFSGNELSIGIILANWVILEAFGSFYFGRKFEKSQHKLETFAVITILFFVSLLAAIFLVRILKSVIGVSIGESIGFWPMFYSSFLLQLPASILHGALFTSSCQIYSLFSGQDPSSAGRVYADETVGTVIGAIVGTYLFIPHLNTFQASIWLALLNFIVCLALLLPYWKTRPFQNTILVVLSVLVFFSGYLVFAGHADKLHHYSIKAQWKNLNVVHYQNSPYGNICVIENEGQYIFFQDGIPTVITPVPDMPFVEEIVHLPALAHPRPVKLLIVSGGAGGMINEILKHPSIEKIDYAELDPLLISLFRKFPTPLTESELSDGRVKITHIDGRLFLRSTQEKYDLILVGITEPSNLQANRFFTKEFFSLAKERLNESGILVLGLPGSLTYMNQELKNLNSSIFHTLRSVFPYIRVVPGDGTNLFLSSDYRGILEIDRMLVMERLIQRKIKADVMIPWYIEQKLHPGWQDWFSLFIQESSQKINSDFTPRGVFYSISHWNALFAPYLRWPFAQFERIDVRTIAPLFVIPLLLYVLFRFRKIRFFRAGIPLVIITTGFAGMIFDLMLIFAFQSIYGYVFSWIGILVASFMAGAAFGAMWITRVLERLKNSFKLFVKIDLAIICFSIVCPYIILGAYSYLGNPDAFFFSKALFLVLSFISGMLIGSQFPLANKLYLRNSTNLSKTAGLLYASDLLGGWFGGIVGAVVLLPVLGLLGTGIVVALLKLTSFISITTYQNQLL